MKLKDSPRVDLPREKLEKYGVAKLTNAELLAILLRTGTKELNVVELSKKILRQFKNSDLADASIQQLQEVKGLGLAKACEIAACFELSRRLLQQKKHELILNPEDVWNLLRDIRDNKKEHFVIFYLDTRNQEVTREIISMGTLNASLVHPREVFEPAVRNSVAQIVIAHNHPSGNPDPSDEDIKVTLKLFEAGKLLGIDLLDHIIVSKEKYFSMKGDGMF